ncbi:MAG: phage tail tube protein [Desulfuromonadaceae bacterium]
MPQAKGNNGLLGLQYESPLAFGVDPSVPDLTKVYFETEGFKASTNLITSNVMTGTRQVSKPLQGNIDCTGAISTELGAYPGMLFYGAAGSIKTEAILGTGETVGAALTTPVPAIDATNLQMSVAATAHGLVIGDTVLIAGITAPTALNNTYVRVIHVTSANNFTVRIPFGVTGNITLGAGTLKKVTAPGQSYKHTIKFGGVLPSFTVEKGFPDIAKFFKYNGLKIGKFSLNCTPEGAQKVSFDFIGKKETVGAVSFDSTATDLGKASFTGFMSGSIEEGGVAIASLTKIDISGDNSLDGGIYVMGGAGTRNSIPEGSCKFSGSIEALFETSALYDKAVAGTESSLRVVYNRGTGVGTAGNESFEIKLPELMFKQETPTISGDKGILYSGPFECYYDNSAEGVTAQIILLTPQLAI